MMWSRVSRRYRATLLAGLASAAVIPAEPAPPAPAAASAPAVNTDDLYTLGQQLFDAYAPPDVKAQYEFPTKQQWDDFLGRLQSALQSDSLDGLASYAPQGRALLSTLHALGAEPELADWLEQRLDELEAAREARSAPGPSLPPPTPPRPGTKPAPAPPRIPYYSLWLARVQSRPAPARASQLMPVLRSAFAAEGVPPALAWLAEAESSMNPSAKSPAGARGLFQLMPATAKQLGLDTFLPDERTNPEKSAHAAARYLRRLHDKFDDWPLALAAYNAGEGRVSRALAARKAKDFAAIADALPAETRMYVPKVCALVAARTGTQLASL